MKMIDLTRTRMSGLVAAFLTLFLTMTMVDITIVPSCLAQSSQESKRLVWKKPKVARKAGSSFREKQTPAKKTPAKHRSSPAAEWPSQPKAALIAVDEPPRQTKLDASPSDEPPSRLQRDSGLSGVDRILQAYNQSKTAHGEVDFTSIIELSEQGLNAKVSDETEQYGNRLVSWAYNRRGEILAEAGREGQAVIDFEAAVRYDKTRWRAFHNRGVSHALAGRHSEAIADFNRTIQINPTYANAYFNRAEVKYELGDFASAVQDYNRAIYLAPNDSAAHNSRGHTYYQLGKFRHAAHDFTEAIKLDPQNAAAYVNRGEMYADLGYYARAIHDYQKAIEIEPELGSAYQGLAWLLATCPDSRFRNPKGALAAANRAIELDGEVSHYHLDTLAAAYASGGDFDEAQTILAQAIDQATQDEQATQETIDQYRVRLSLYEQGKPFVSRPRPIPPSTSKKQRARRVRPQPRI